MMMARFPMQKWLARPADLVTLYEVPILAVLLGSLTAIAALIWHGAHAGLFIASAWLFALAAAWVCSCTLRVQWTRCVAGLAIGVAFVALAWAIAATEPPPPPWMHVGQITIGKEAATGGVRLVARVEFENDSDDTATVVMPSAWLFAKAEDGLSIADAAARVRSFAAAAPKVDPAAAGPHELHHVYIIGPAQPQRIIDDEIGRGARFFVAGTITINGARPAVSVPFCAFAGATASGVITAGSHDCPMP